MPDSLADLGSTPSKSSPTFDALGHFLVAFSILEAVIEVGIAKQLNLDPVRASIVTAGLQFKSRACMLCSLLNLEPEQNAAAIKELKSVMAKGERNDIVHAVIGGGMSGDSITFYRRKVAHEYKAYWRQFSSLELMRLAAEFATSSADLSTHLGISGDVYKAFFQEAHSFSSKAR